jgi:Transposase IS66 family
MTREPGKQPGPPGAFLAWNEHPDKAGDVFPEGICPCGADLAGARDLGVRYSHQVTDLPGARAVTIQHHRHEVECACGRRHVADAPPRAGAPGTVSYGLNLQAWCVFLLVMHHVPVERCADIIASMSGTRPGDGWVHGLLERAARAVAAANKAIRALIILARVVCGDETPLRAALRHREAGVLRFLTDTATPRPATRPNATCGLPEPSRRSPAGSAQRKPPATGMPFAATPPPPPSTGSPSSPPSATPSPETPGYRRSRPAPEPHPKTVTHGDSSITKTCCLA